MFLGFVLLLTQLLTPTLSTYAYTKKFGGLAGANESLLGIGSIKKVVWSYSKTFSAVIIYSLNDIEVNFGSELLTNIQLCGSMNILDFPDRHIVKIEIWSGACMNCSYSHHNFVRSLKFTTNKGDSYDCSATYNSFDYSIVEAINVTSFNGSTWLSGIISNNGAIMDGIKFQFQYFNGTTTDLGISTSWTDDIICSTTTYYQFENGYYAKDLYEDGNINGTNGHTTCLYGPYDNYNSYFSREFITGYASNIPVTLTISVRFWQICTVDSNDSISISVIDKTNSLVYTVYNNIRQDWTQCGNFSEYNGDTNTGWFNTATCIENYNSPCYEDINVSIALTSNNFIIKFRGVLNTEIDDEGWAVSDFKIDINTPAPTSVPTSKPSLYPSTNPSGNPTVQPTVYPSTNPTVSPSVYPNRYPSFTPSTMPTISPIKYPTTNPTTNPSTNPNIEPTIVPNSYPSSFPTMTPSNSLSFSPHQNPTKILSNFPTLSPTKSGSSSIKNNNGNNEIFLISIMLILCLLLLVGLAILYYLYKVKNNKNKDSTNKIVNYQTQSSDPIKVRSMSNISTIQTETPKGSVELIRISNAIVTKGGGETDDFTDDNVESDSDENSIQNISQTKSKINVSIIEFEDKKKDKPPVEIINYINKVNSNEPGSFGQMLSDGNLVQDLVIGDIVNDMENKNETPGE